MEFVAIRWNDGSVSELSGAFAEADAYQGKAGYLSPEYAIALDGFESYAKGWWFPDGRLARIGAGSHGGLTLIERDPAGRTLHPL